jgi:hypothetical protein
MALLHLDVLQVDFSDIETFKTVKIEVERK